MSDWQCVKDVLAGKHTGQAVRLRGWVHRQRSGGKIAFITLRDGTGTVQCTVKAGIADDDSLEAAKGALIESSISLLEGEVVADERAPGGFEVKATKVAVHQRSEDFPLRGEQGTDFELDNRHLWLRSTQLSTVLRIKSRLLHAIRDFFAQESFTEVDPSVITTNACEGGSTLFTFDYFGQEAYLSQSAQMYLEGCIFGNPKVYSVTNSFRAEKSRTSKHLTEFHHLEAEYAWWDNEESMRFQERLVTYLAHDIATHCADELRTLEQDPERLLQIGNYIEGESEADEDGRRFGRMTYHEAAAKLREDGFEFPDGEDFGTPHEAHLTEGLTNPVFITDWPADIKAFYMHRNPDGKTVACADLLGPDGFGELIGGSQRSEDIEWMKKRLVAQSSAESLEPTFDWSDPADVEGLAMEDWGWSGAQPDPTMARAILEGIAAGNEPDDAFATKPDEALAAACSVIGRRHGIPSRWGIEAGGKGQFRFTPGGLLPEHGEWKANRRDAMLDWWHAIEEYILEPYAWYFDLRRYGSVPHSGFGLGIERLVRWFTGVEHIRDTLPYPRTPSRAYP